MLDSVPSRPLTRHEVDALSESKSLQLAVPATPESIRDDEDGQQRIYDVLLFLEGTVVAIAYQETDRGWTVVTRETDETDDAYEVAYDELLAYRGYDELAREEAMEQVVKKMYGVPEDLIEADPDELESLRDR
jgi:hypothetical protein